MAEKQGVSKGFFFFSLKEPLNRTKEPGTIAFLVYQQFWTTASLSVCLSLGGSSVGKEKNKVFRALRVYGQCHYLTGRKQVGQTETMKGVVE